MPKVHIEYLQEKTTLRLVNNLFPSWLKNNRQMEQQQKRATQMMHLSSLNLLQTTQRLNGV